MPTPVLKIESINVSGHRLSITRGGDSAGPCYVLIHGVGMSGRYFYPLAQRLATSSQVVVVDLPGFGRSSKPKSALSLGEQADVVHEMISSLHIERPIFAGHSMGCEVVVELLRRHPLSGPAAILIGPTINRAERRVWYQFCRLLQNGIREPPALNFILTLAYLQCGLRRYLQTLRHMLNDRVEEKIAVVTIPLLIIRGESDSIVGHEWSQYLASCSSSPVHIEEIPRAAHGVHFSQVDMVAQVCVDFIRTLHL